MLVKKSRLFEINAAIQAAGDIKDFKFAYALQKNLAKIKPEIEAVNNSMKPPKEYDEYIYSIQRNGGQSSLEIEKQFADVINKVKRVEKEVNDFLKTEEIEIDFFQIDQSYIDKLKDEVKNQITVRIQSGLYPEIIKE